MSDLVKRLDQALHFENWMPVPDNFSQAVPLLRESRNRIEELEAKLAEVVAVGVRVRDYFTHHSNDDVYAVHDFNEAIAYLKGQNDE